MDVFSTDSHGGGRNAERVPTTILPPALITGGKGGRSGCSGTISSSSATSPTLLKEQLELIHQIIQQAQEECINNSSAPNNKTKTFKGKKAKTTSGSLPSPAIKSKPDGFEDLSKFGSSDDKPVECTICFRRFKNTPALNGHMRLHGGYFKGGKVNNCFMLCEVGDDEPSTWNWKSKKASTESV